MIVVIHFNCLETKEKNKKATSIAFKALNQKCLLHEPSESPRMLVQREAFGVGGMWMLRQKEGTSF